MIIISNKNKLNVAQKGFTLAEVLITLGIIGIIAALTMPALISDYKEKATVAKLKKVYSIFSQVMLQAQAEHGMISAWCPEGLSQIQCQPYIYDILKPYFRISKDCGFKGGCFANSKVLLIDGTNYNANYGSASTEWSTFILQDGISVLLQYYTSPAVGIYVDIDNFRGSNTYGKDVFIFHATDDKVVPVGMRTEAGGDALSAYCGRYCAAWVLANENMDYLHCNDLSWNGKTKCK